MYIKNKYSYLFFVLPFSILILTTYPCTNHHDIAAYSWDILDTTPQQYTAEQQYGIGALLYYINASKELLKLADIIANREKAATIHHELLNASKHLCINSHTQLLYTHHTVPHTATHDTEFDYTYYSTLYTITYKELLALIIDLKKRNIISESITIIPPAALSGSKPPTNTEITCANRDIDAFLTSPDYHLTLAHTILNIMLNTAKKEIWKSDTGTILIGVIKKRNEFILKKIAKLKNIEMKRALYLVAQQGILQNKINTLQAH